MYCYIMLNRCAECLKFRSRMDKVSAPRIETVAEEYVCAMGVQPGSEAESPEEGLCKLKLGSLKIPKSLWVSNGFNTKSWYVMVSVPMT